MERPTRGLSPQRPVRPREALAALSLCILLASLGTSAPAPKPPTYALTGGGTVPPAWLHDTAPDMSVISAHASPRNETRNRQPTHLLGHLHRVRRDARADPQCGHQYDLGVRPAGLPQVPSSESPFLGTRTAAAREGARPRKDRVFEKPDLRAQSLGWLGAHDHGAPSGSAR